jgi:hypothetical protein
MGFTISITENIYLKANQNNQVCPLALACNLALFELFCTRLYHLPKESSLERAVIWVLDIGD